jgi:hypothetical protein
VADYYRGGTSLKPRRSEVIIDPVSGLVLPVRGISVSSSPNNLEHFGGPYLVTNVPAELQIVQKGNNPTHFEIIPAYPMTPAEYEDALNKLVLVAVQSPGS